MINREKKDVIPGHRLVSVFEWCLEPKQSLKRNYINFILQLGCTRTICMEDLVRNWKQILVKSFCIKMPLASESLCIHCNIWSPVFNIQDIQDTPE